MKCKQWAIFSKFSDCFWEIGTSKNIHHIEIKDNVTPVVTPVRKIPHALKPKLENELKWMVDLNIIELPKNQPRRLTYFCRSWKTKQKTPDMSWPKTF